MIFAISTNLKSISKLCSNRSLFTSIPMIKYEFRRLNFAKQSSESILKQYFSSRLTLSPMQLQQFIIDLSKNNDVKIKDHRWQSLYMTIQKHHQRFSLQSKLQIIQALARMKQNNSLYLTLYKSVISQFHQLTINQMALLLWTMVKTQQKDKQILLAIYKKLYKIMQNNEKMKIYKQNQKLPFDDLQNERENFEKEDEVVHHIHESNFVQLIWALQKTKIVDNKLILSLIKNVLQNQQSNNLQKIRMSNLCLLAYSMVELEMEKYRIYQTIINKIKQSWFELQKLSLLSLVLLHQSFCKFVFFQEHYLKRHQADLSPEQTNIKKRYLANEKNFILLIVQTIFLRQDLNVQSAQFSSNSKIHHQQQNQQQLTQLKMPLSTKFASQILFNLGRINLFEKKIWFKLLVCITEDVSQAETQDVSMVLTAICNLNQKQLCKKDKQFLYSHKKILCKRIFQIYTSLSGLSLLNIHRLVSEKKLEKQLVPSRVRTAVQKQQMLRKVKQEQSKIREYQLNSQSPTDSSEKHNLENQASQIPSHHSMPQTPQKNSKFKNIKVAQMNKAKIADQTK